MPQDTEVRAKDFVISYCLDKASISKDKYFIISFLTYKNIFFTIKTILKLKYF